MLSLGDNGRALWDWLVQNKQWIFSGIGVTALAVIWWLGRKLFGGSKDNTTSGSNSQVNIHFSPNISQSNTQTTVVPEGRSTGAQPPPDIRFIRHSSEFNPRIGTGKNCVVLAFRNDGNADATNVVANISYTRSPGHAMVVDYGAWVEHDPIINISRGHTKRLILAVSEDEKKFAVTDTAPSTGYTDLRVQSVGEIKPANWQVVVTLSADNFRRDYTFNLNVSENGNFLLYADNETRSPLGQMSKKIDTTPQTNLVLCRLHTEPLFRDGDKFSLYVKQGTENQFKRIRSIVADIMNRSLESVAIECARNIKAELVFDVDERNEVIGPLAWLDTTSNTVSIEMGDTKHLILASFVLSAIPDFKEWRFPINPRPRSDEASGVEKVVLKRWQPKSEGFVRLNILHPDSGTIIRGFKGSYRWPGGTNDPTFNFAESEDGLP